MLIVRLWFIATHLVLSNGLALRLVCFHKFNSIFLGYGFLTLDSQFDIGKKNDVFVHKSEFIREGPRDVFYILKEGDKVVF